MDTVADRVGDIQIVVDDDHPVGGLELAEAEAVDSEFVNEVAGGIVDIDRRGRRSRDVDLSGGTGHDHGGIGCSGATKRCIRAHGEGVLRDLGSQVFSDQYFTFNSSPRKALGAEGVVLGAEVVAIDNVQSLDLAVARVGHEDPHSRLNRNAAGVPVIVRICRDQPTLEDFLGLNEIGQIEPSNSRLAPRIVLERVDAAGGRVDGDVPKTCGQ